MESERLDRGNHKDEGGKSAAGVSNPLAANRCPIFMPLTGSGAAKKGASHTQAPGSKKDAKGVSTTQG